MKNSITILVQSVIKKIINKFFIIGINEKRSLLSNFYSILISENYTPKCIYDIGANKGTWTRECMNFFPNSNYILFEPQPNLRNNIEKCLRGKNNYSLYTVGVGNVNDKLLFTYHDRDDSCSFVISEEEAAQKGYKQVYTPIVRLDSFVEENNLQKPDILKIDAEGIDLDVLAGASQIINSHVEIVLVEVGVMNKHIKNSSLEVLKYMDNANFKLFDITDLNRPFKNNVLWLCEFVFIKKNGILDKEYSES